MAISHVFSNTIPDGTNTNIVRPSDWNSAHNQYYTLSGNTLGASTVSGTNVVLQGSGNVSLSGTGQTVVVYATGGGGIAAAAGSQTATSGTINFVNSNGITFGMSNSSQITASYSTAPTSNITAGNNIALSTSGSTLTISAQAPALGAGTQTATSGTVNFLNSNGITFGMSNSSQITASYTVPTVPTSYVSNVNGSSGQISLNVGSSLSSSTNGSSITFGLASNITTALQSAGAYLTTARASNDAVGLNTAATNVTWTVNSSGVSLNAAGYAGTGTSATNASVTLNSAGLAISVAAPGAANYSIGVSNLGNTAGSTGITGTRIVFVGTNNISLSQSTDANGATISFNQTGGGGGAMYANLSGNTSGNTTASGSTLNLSGINITLSGTNNSQIAISAPATSSLSAGNNISFSTTGSTINVSARAVAAAAGTQTALSGTVNFANSNGITFGMSGSNQITASYTVPSFSAGISNLGNTAGSTGVSGSRIVFVGTNNISLSQSTDANGATISINQTGGGGGGIAAAAGTQTATSGTVNFANSNGITFGMSGSNQITASYTVPATTGFAGTGFTSTTTAGTAVQGTLSTNGLNLAVPAYLTAGNAIGVTGGVNSGTGATGTIYFATGNNFTFGFDTASSHITASWALGVYDSVTNQNVRRLSFANSNGMTFGLITGTGVTATLTASHNGLTNINVSAGTTSNNLSNIVFNDANGVSFGLNGSTVTASVSPAAGVIASGYSPHGDYPLVVGQIGQGTLALDPDIFPDLTVNMLAVPINFSHATNSTGSFTVSNWVGLYSRSESSLSLAHSTSFTKGITFSGTQNSVSHVGWRNLTYNWSTSVSGGRYWIAQIVSTTTGGANCSFSQYLASQVNTNFSGAFGAATATSAQFTLGQGFYSAATGALPVSIAFTQIQGTNSLAQRFPIVQFGFNTV